MFSLCNFLFFFFFFFFFLTYFFLILSSSSSSCLAVSSSVSRSRSSTMGGSADEPARRLASPETPPHAGCRLVQLISTSPAGLLLVFNCHLSLLYDNLASPVSHTKRSAVAQRLRDCICPSNLEMWIRDHALKRSLEDGTIRKLWFGFLFAFYSEYGHIFICFHTIHERDRHPARRRVTAKAALCSLARQN